MKKIIEINPITKIPKEKRKEFDKAVEELFDKFNDVPFFLCNRMIFRFNEKYLKKPLDEKDVWVNVSNRVRPIKKKYEKE